MADSREFLTVLRCSKSLETALQEDRDVVYFLHREGFITGEMCDDLLNPRSLLTAAEKAGQLVTRIRNRVELSSQEYHKLVEHFLQNRRKYGSIVDTLDKEYAESDTERSVRTLPGHSNNHPPSAISRYQVYLKSYYENSTIMLDDKLFIAPCGEFINLILVTKQTTYSNAEHQCVTIQHSLEMDSILTPDSRFVLVEGPTGIGKSTLCWELCRKWDSLKSLRDFKIVLLLKLREKRIQNVRKLQEIFYHEDKGLSQSVVKEVYRCEGEGVLLIFDGFDEIPPSVARGERSLIMKLCSGKCLPKAARLVTSRPSVLSVWNFFPGRARTIEILGFTDESKMKFTENVVKFEPEIFSHFKNFIFSNSVISSLMCVPVNCAIIAQLYKDIGRCRKLIINTMTQLYNTLVLVLIRRHMIERGKWDEYSRVPSNFRDLPQEVITALKRVSELAYRGLQHCSVVSLSFTDAEIGDRFQHLGLLTETKEMYVCGGARSSYSFFHQSIQEFLAAWHISRFPINHKNLISQIFGEPVEGTLGLFLSGLTDGYNKLNLNCLTNFKLGCLYESQDPKIFMNKKSSPYPESLFLETSYIFGYTLANAPVQWDLTVTGPLDMLAISLADHASSDHKILGSIRKLNLYSEANSNQSSRLRGLPNCLLQCIDGLVVGISNPIIPVVIEDLTVLLSLKHIYLDFSALCPDDYLLYQKLRDVPNLESVKLHCYHVSTNGMQELSKTLSGSHSLEDFTMKYYGDVSFSFNSVLQERNYLKLIEVALTCSNLKKLTVVRYYSLSAFSY